MARNTGEVARDLASGDAVLRYVVTYEAWYGKSVRDHRDDVVAELSIGVDPKDGGGTYGEGGIRWIDLGSTGPTARLELFHDSWAVFASVPGFYGIFGDLGGDRSPTVDEVRRKLEEIGFRDMTERTRPGFA